MQAKGNKISQLSNFLEKKKALGISKGPVKISIDWVFATPQSFTKDI